MKCKGRSITIYLRMSTTFAHRSFSADKKDKVNLSASCSFTPMAKAERLEEDRDAKSMSIESFSRVGNLESDIVLTIVVMFAFSSIHWVLSLLSFIIFFPWLDLIFHVISPRSAVGSYVAKSRKNRRRGKGKRPDPIPEENDDGDSEVEEDDPYPVDGHWADQAVPGPAATTTLNITNNNTFKISPIHHDNDDASERSDGNVSDDNTQVSSVTSPRIFGEFENDSVCRNEKLQETLNAAIDTRSRLSQLRDGLSGSFVVALFYLILAQFGLRPSDVLRRAAQASLALLLTCFAIRTHWSVAALLATCAVAYDHRHLNILTMSVHEEDELMKQIDSRVVSLDVAAHRTIPDAAPLDEINLPRQAPRPTVLDQVEESLSSILRNGGSTSVMSSLGAILGSDCGEILNSPYFKEFAFLISQLLAMPSYIPESEVIDGNISSSLREAKNRETTVNRLHTVTTAVLRFVGDEHTPIVIALSGLLGVGSYLAKDSDDEVKVVNVNDGEPPSFFSRFGTVLSVSNGVFNDKDFWAVAKCCGALAVLPLVKAGFVDESSVELSYSRLMKNFTPKANLLNVVTKSVLNIIKRIHLASASPDPIRAFLSMEARSHDQDLLELTSMIAYVNSGEVHSKVDDLPRYMADVTNKSLQWKAEHKCRPSKILAEKIKTAEELVRRISGAITASGKVVEPLAVTLIGDPATGKTEFAKIGIKMLLTQMGIPNPVTAPINITSKFDDNAHPGVHGFTGDDPLKQRLEHTSQGNKPSDLMFRYTSSEPVLINKPDLADKGWQYFNHNCIFWTVNNLDVKHDCVSDGAFKRRMGHLFRTRVVAEYRLPNGKLDIAKALANQEQNTQEFQAWHWITDSNGAIVARPIDGTWMNLSQWLVHMKPIIDEWNLKRSVLLKRTETKFVKCEHGLIAQYCPICDHGDTFQDAIEDSKKLALQIAKDPPAAFRGKSSCVDELVVEAVPLASMGWLDFCISLVIERHGEKYNDALEALKDFFSPSNRESIVFFNILLCMAWFLASQVIPNVSVAVTLQLMLALSVCLNSVLWYLHKRVGASIEKVAYCNPCAISDAQTDFFVRTRFFSYVAQRYVKELKFARIAGTIAASGVAALVIRKVLKSMARPNYVGKSNGKYYEGKVVSESTLNSPKGIVIKPKKASEMAACGETVRKCSQDFWKPPQVSRIIMDEDKSRGTMQHLEFKFRKCYVQCLVQASAEGASKNETVCGFLLTNRVVVLPFHVFTVGNKTFNRYTLTLRGSNTPQVGCEVQRTSIIVPDTSKDVCMVLLSNNLHDVPSIIDYFPQEITPGEVQAYFLEYGCEFEPQTRTLVKLKSAEEEFIDYESSGGHMHTRVLKAKMPRVMKNGECGQLLRFENNSTACLGAMLVAGNDQEDCFALITRDLLLSGMRTMKEVLGYYPSPPYEGVSPDALPKGPQKMLETHSPHPKLGINYVPENCVVHFKGAVADSTSLRNDEQVHPYAPKFIESFGVKKHAIPTHTDLSLSSQRIVAHACNHPIGHDPAKMKVVTDAMCQYIRKHSEVILEGESRTGLAKARPLRIEEALNGVEGTNVGLLPMGKSDGCGGKKRDRLEFNPGSGRYQLTNKAAKEFKEYSSDIAEGRNSGFFSKVFCKVENKEVKNTGDIEPIARLVNAPNFNNYLMGRMLMDPLMEVLKQCPRIFFTAIGANVEDKSWDSLMRPMAQPLYRDNVIETDASKYDASQNPVMRNASIPVWIEVAKILGWDEPDLALLESYLTSLLDTTVEVQGILTSWPNFFLSGINITAADNGLRGVLNLLYCYYELCASSEKLSQFLDDLEMVTLGDDSLAAVHSKYRSEGWGPADIAAISDRCGIRLTSANKTGKIDWINITQATFLKRRNVYNDSKGCIVGASSPLSFTKSMLYTQRPEISWDAHALELCQNVARESYSIGRECYNLYIHGVPMVDANGKTHSFPGMKHFILGTPLESQAEELLISWDEYGRREMKRYQYWGLSNPGLPTDISAIVMAEWDEACEGAPQRKKFQIPEVSYVAKSEEHEGPVLTSDEAKVEQSQPNTLTTDVDAVTMESHEFAHWENRVVEFPSVQIPEGAEVIQSVTPYTTFFNHPTMRDQHIAHVALFNAGLRFTVTWGSAVAHSGLMWMYFTHGEIMGFLEGLKDPGLVLNRVSCRTFVPINFAEGSGKAVLEIPFIYTQNLCPLEDVELDTLGQLRFRTVHPLRHQNGSTTPVTLRIRAELINPKFGLSTAYVAKSGLADLDQLTMHWRPATNSDQMMISAGMLRTICGDNVQALSEALPGCFESKMVEFHRFHSIYKLNMHNHGSSAVGIEIYVPFLSQICFCAGYRFQGDEMNLGSDLMDKELIENIAMLCSLVATARNTSLAIMRFIARTLRRVLSALDASEENSLWFYTFHASQADCDLRELTNDSGWCEGFPLLDPSSIRNTTEGCKAFHILALVYQEWNMRSFPWNRNTAKVHFQRSKYSTFNTYVELLDAYLQSVLRDATNLSELNKVELEGAYYKRIIGGSEVNVLRMGTGVDGDRNVKELFYKEAINIPGLCYLACVAEEHRSEMFHTLGKFPTIAELVAYLRYVPHSLRRGFSLEGGSEGYVHMVPNSNSTYAESFSLFADFEHSRLIGAEESPFRGNSPATTSKMTIVGLVLGFFLQLIHDYFRSKVPTERHEAGFANWDIEQPFYAMGHKKSHNYKAKSKVVGGSDTGEKMSSKLWRFTEIVSSVRPLTSYLPYGTVMSDLISKAAGAAAEAMYQFGFSRPLNTGAEVYQPVIANGLANGNGPYNAQVLGLDVMNETYKNVPYSGSDGTDQLSFSYLKECWNMVAIREWDDSPSIDSSIIEFNITPSICLSTKEGVFVSGDSFQLTPSAMCAAVTGLWHGTMEYKMVFNGSSMVQGKVRVTWDPHGSSVNAPTIQNSAIIDLSQEREKTFHINFAREALALKTFGSRNTPAGSSMGADYDPALHNGRIVVRVYTPLVSTGTGTPYMSVALWARCASNMQFIDPSCTPLQERVHLSNSEAPEFMGVQAVPPALIDYERLGWVPEVYEADVPDGEEHREPVLDPARLAPPIVPTSAPTPTPGPTTGAPTKGPAPVTGAPTSAPFISTMLPTGLSPSTPAPSVSTFSPTLVTNAPSVSTAAPTVGPNCEKVAYDMQFPPSIFSIDGTLRVPTGFYYRVADDYKNDPSFGVILAGETGNVEFTTMITDDGSFAASIIGSGFSGGTSFTTLPGVTVEVASATEIRILGTGFPLGHTRVYFDFTPVTNAYLNSQVVLMPESVQWNVIWAEDLAGGNLVTVPNPQSGTDVVVRRYDRSVGEFAQFGPFEDACSNDGNYVYVVWTGHRSIGDSFENLGRTLTQPNGEAVWCNRGTPEGNEKFVSEMSIVPSGGLFMSGSANSTEPLEILAVYYISPKTTRRGLRYWAKSGEVPMGEETPPIVWGRDETPEELAPTLAGEHVLSMRTILNNPHYMGLTGVNAGPTPEELPTYVIDPLNVPISPNSFTAFTMLRDCFFGCRGGMVVTHNFVADVDVQAEISYKCTTSQDPFRNLVTLVDTRVNPSVTVKCPYRSERYYYLIFQGAPTPVTTSHREYVRLSTPVPAGVLMNTWISTSEDFNFLYFLGGPEMTVNDGIVAATQSN